MQKNPGRKSKTPTPILTPTPAPFSTPTSAPKSSKKAPNDPAKRELTTKMMKKRKTPSPPLISDSSGSSNNSVDEPSDDDIVDVVAINSATSFAESTSSSAGNISPVVSSFGVDFVDTLIEEEDKSNLAATAAATIILPGAVIANSPSGAAAAAASSNSNEKDPDLNMYKGGFSFGDDDPEYDKSDPDVTFDDHSPSSLDDSWQSTSEEEIIGDVSMMDHDDVDNLVAAKVTTTIHSSGDRPVYVPKTATSTTTTAATTTSSSGSNNNNNNTTTQAPRILKLERLGSQDVIVEKQLKRIDPQQHQKQQQQSAKKQQQQQQQQKQQKQKPIQQQQNTLVKGNKNKNNNSNSKSNPKQPTYSQIAKSVNSIKSSSQAASGPASRHLSQFQEKLRAEQQVQKQQLQQQQKHQEQPVNSLRLALQINTETIALMGKKMDAMLESIKVLLSNLITDNNTPQLQAQQSHLHLEPIVEIAPPNPNDMSVDATPDITTANDAINYE
ncbi:hypothetical protein ACLKA6_013305 [Drosophila palustris]